MNLYKIVWFINSFLAALIWPPGAGCPPPGCFHIRCWEIRLVDDHVLHALCIPDSGIRTDMKENLLDLSTCVGVVQGGLVWEDDGLFDAVAEEIHLGLTDNFKDFALIELRAMCPGSRPGERFPCQIDISERIWAENGQLGGSNHRAEYTEPFHPFKHGGPKETAAMMQRKQHIAAALNAREETFASDRM